MAYYLAPRPAGTSAYKPREKSPFEQIAKPLAAPFGSAFQEAVKRETGPKEEKAEIALGKTKSALQMLLAGLDLPEGYGMGTPEEQTAKREKLRKRVETEPYLRSYLGVKEEKKPGYTETIKKAKAGEISWDEVAKDFPTKDVGKTRIKVKAETDFQERIRRAAQLDPEVAKLDRATKKVLANIKKLDDISELEEYAEAYKTEGVDVDYILKFFGRK